MFLFPLLDFNNRESETMDLVHVINIDIQDNHEEATLGAFVVCELAKLVCVLSIFLAMPKINIDIILRESIVSAVGN